VTASAAGTAGTSQVVLQNYSLTLPHQTTWASKIDDPLARILLLALAVLGAVSVVTAIAVSLRAGALSRLVALTRSEIPPSRTALTIGIGAVALYLAGNALLFPLGSHPFDMGGAKLWAYVARVYGIAQLYYLPNLVSVTSTWHGVPYIESAFPYEPISAYLSGALGWLYSLVLAGGGRFNPSSTQLEYLIKGVNVLFGLADAALIYLILKQLGASMRWRLTASGLFLFNPAVWFSMSVWGQTHVFSLFFVLTAVLLLERQRPTLAWMSLAAACLTRPQILVFGVLLGIVFIRRFPWKVNVTAVSWTVIVMFIALVPFTLATSPSLPIDIMLHNFRVQEAGGNEASLTTVSQSALSIWPMVTYLAHGASGLQRAFAPASETAFGSVTYQLLSQILTVAAMLIVAGMLLFRKRASLVDGGYIPIVALGITSFLMLLTGILATHWMGGVAYYYIAAIWTVTTFVPMYGDMGVLISSLDYPLLSPAHNAITAFVMNLYAWDRFITVAVVANVCAVLWLAYLTYRYFAPPRPSVATQT
jgi:hypothetical protein